MSESQSENSAPKRVLYPYLGMERTLGFADSIKSLGGHREEIPKSLIAKQLKLTEDAPMLTSLVGSAKAFGMIEGWRSLKLTEAAKKFFYPTTPVEKQQALLKMVVTPVVFEKLAKRFDGGQLPPNELLGNLVHSEMDVPESWAARVVSNFISSMTLAGALDDGILRYEAAIHGSRFSSSPDTENPSTITGVGQPAGPATVSGTGTVRLVPTTEKDLPNWLPGSMNVWVYGNEESAVKVESSKTLSVAAWKKLQQYVQILKPEDFDA